MVVDNCCVAVMLALIVGLRDGPECEAEMDAVGDQVSVAGKETVCEKLILSSVVTEKVTDSEMDSDSDAVDEMSSEIVAENDGDGVCDMSPVAETVSDTLGENEADSDDDKLAEADSDKLSDADGELDTDTDIE
jgi:hypothetical protein